MDQLKTVNVLKRTKHQKALVVKTAQSRRVLSNRVLDRDTKEAIAQAAYLRLWNEGGSGSS